MYRSGTWVFLLVLSCEKATSLSVLFLNKTFAGADMTHCIKFSVSLPNREGISFAGLYISCL